VVVLDRGRVALDGNSRTVATNRTLDKVFGVDFQRAPIDPSLGPLLPYF